MDRRNFLKYSINGLGFLVGASLFIPAAGYFLSPIWKKEEEDWILLGDSEGVPLGKPMQVEFTQRRKDGWMTVEQRRSAWMVTKDGKDFTVFDPHCTHLGCPYRWDEGRGQFICPCHTAIFDLDGNVVSGPPPRPLDRMEAKVEAGKIWVKPVAKG